MSTSQFVNNLGETLEQGDVVIIGRAKKSSLDGLPAIIEADLADSAYDTRVCGIVCEVHVELKLDSDLEPGPAGTAKKAPRAKAGQKEPKAESSGSQAFSLAELELLDRTKVHPGQLGYLINQGVYSYCKVDADIAPINPGDLLTTSPTRGHAQKVLQPTKAVGAILGKALGSLKKGKGRIPVLITLE
jgi:hypothetical protein